MKVHLNTAKYGLLTVAIAISIFTSCEKKHPPIPKITGLWKGTYLNQTTGDVVKCTYIFTEQVADNNRNIMRYYNSWDTASATNKYSGYYNQLYHKVFMNYTLNTNGAVYYSEEAIVDDTKRHFDGTWGDKLDPANGGTTKGDLQ
jgi:hypothetical protein